MNTVLEKGIEDSAMDLADRASHTAYVKLCDKWGINKNPAMERLFKAGFASGAHAGITAIIEATKTK